MRRHFSMRPAPTPRRSLSATPALPRPPPRTVGAAIPVPWLTTASIPRQDKPSPFGIGSKNQPHPKPHARFPAILSQSLCLRKTAFLYAYSRFRCLLRRPRIAVAPYLHSGTQSRRRVNPYVFPRKPRVEHPPVESKRTPRPDAQGGLAGLSSPWGPSWAASK